jgi:hypothetical protein
VTIGEIAAYLANEQAVMRQMGSPFTADLLAAAAEALTRPGPAGALLGEWAGHPRKDALAQRLASALQTAVLRGDAPEVAAYYPTRAVPGDGRAAWDAAQGFLEREQLWVADWMRSPPQTNEVRRAGGLFPAMLVVAAEHELPVVLLELGASAGLNLCLDAFAYRNNVWSFGTGDVLIETDWTGEAPPLESFVVAQRRGCDQNPLDVSDSADRMRLLSYVWADQFDRKSRLQAAMDLAAHMQPHMERGDAGDWIETQLAAPVPGHLTIVFHSIFYHYPNFATRTRIANTIAEAGRRATIDAPLAWVRYEFEAILGGPIDSTRSLLDVTCWPGGTHRVLAEVDSHGRSVHWM